MSNPLVTITIPTYNSAKFINFCLSALKNQSYKNIEINIIDGFSKDETIEIAEKFPVKEINKIKGSLLQARYEGVKLAKGKYVLLLDSDQILSKDTIERAVEKMEKEDWDMVVLEEDVYHPNTFVEKLFQMDRRLINKVNNLNPFTGVIMPRFFKRDLLRQSYANIEPEFFSNTGGPDHAIVYYEAWLISKKVGVLTDAVKHMEPSTLKELMKRFYRWGYTSVEAHYGHYHHLMSQREKLFRSGLFTKGMFKESVGSVLLLLFKGLAFKIGYYKGVFDRHTQFINR